MSKEIVVPLSTSDFEHYLGNIPDLLPHWAGVKALDEIPTHLKVKSFLIVNTSVKEKKYGHWIVIGRTHLHVLEVFNSLGFESLSAIKPNLNFSFKSEIIYNNSPVQLASSSSCGLYCIFYAVHRFFNLDLPFEEFMEDMFTSDLNKNEMLVSNFCHHVLNLSDAHDLFLLDF